MIDIRRQYLSHRLFYCLQTLWLFTYSDLKTMVFPSTAFALLTCMANILAQPEKDHPGEIALIFRRIPLILIWTWINCLAFNINNQKLPHAIQEDEFNKPWRPLPAKRLTPSQASALGVVVYPIAVLASTVTGGGVASSLLLIVFGYAYNDLRVGDRSAFFRNILNAFGFTSFAAGALEVAQGYSIERQTLKWVQIIFLVVFTTVHIQDLYDQVGDKAAGRLTIPIILGDAPARYSVIVLILIWSYLCPSYWNASFAGYAAVSILGAIIATRLFMVRTVEGDRSTFVIYNLWLVSTYALPLVRNAATI